MYKADIHLDYSIWHTKCSQPWSDLFYDYISTFITVLKTALLVLVGSTKYQFISTTSHHITTNVKTQRPQDSYCENSLRDLLRKHIRGWFYDPILHQSPLSPVDFSPGNCVWPTHITLSLGNQPLLSPTTPTLRVHWLGIIGGHPLLLYLSLPDPSSPTVFSVLVKTTCRFPKYQ